jgi:hypothetical protein
MYLIIKHLHMTFALLSILGVIVRGALAIKHHPIMQQKWMRIVPHINDTLLLITAITLASILLLNPLNHSWLMTKIIALLWGPVPFCRGNDGLNSKHQRCRHPSRFGQSPFTVRLREGPRSRVIYEHT